MPTFEQEMQQQRDRARQARQNSQSMQVQSEVLKIFKMKVNLLAMKLRTINH